VADSPDRKTARPLTTLGGVEPDSEVVKTRPWLLSALATAEVHQDNIDEARRLGVDALKLGEQ
jgi:hypothetical protein